MAKKTTEALLRVAKSKIKVSVGTGYTKGVKGYHTSDGRMFYKAHQAVDWQVELEVLKNG